MRKRLLTFSPAARQSLHSDTRDCPDDGALGTLPADHIRQIIRDFLRGGHTSLQNKQTNKKKKKSLLLLFYFGHKQPFVSTYNRHVDLVGAEGRLAGQRDGRVGGEVPDHLEAPQLAAHLLHSHALKHKLK